jgi:hypothetical protein
MIRTTDRDNDLPAERGSELRTQLLDDLRRAYKPAPKLSAVDAAILRMAHDRSDLQTNPKTAAKRPRRRLRLAVPIAALVMLSLGIGTYLHSPSPTPVSAQTILRRAATAGLTPNQITHFVYQITSSTGYSGTSQFWVKSDADGAPTRIAFDVSEPCSQQPKGDQRACAPARVAINVSDPENVAIPRHLVGAYEAYVAHNLPASLAGSQVVGHQTLDGVPVDVVQEPSGAVLYFDAQSYIVRGADWSMDKDGTSSPSFWHARLLQYGTVPASAAPAGPWHSHGGLPATSGTTKPRTP